MSEVTDLQHVRGLFRAQRVDVVERDAVFLMRSAMNNRSLPCTRHATVSCVLLGWNCTSVTVCGTSHMELEGGASADAINAQCWQDLAGLRRHARKVG